VKVRKYDPANDFDQIKEWGAEWGAEYLEDQFPMTGFIIDGVAAYFLYSTDSSVCWLENMVAKRGVDELTRDRALTLLVDAILLEAVAKGFTVAYATTDNIPVAKRAKEHGAIVRAGQILLTKDLTTRTQ
jgi:hypothetical protein